MGYVGGISTTFAPLSEGSTVYVGERNTRLAEEFVKWLSVHEVEADETADDPLDFACCPVNHLGSREFQLRKKGAFTKRGTSRCVGFWAY